MLIQISWLLQKPTDLDLHCLLRQDISCLAREGLTLDYSCLLNLSKNTEEDTHDMTQTRSSLPEAPKEMRNKYCQMTPLTYKQWRTATEELPWTVSKNKKKKTKKKKTKKKKKKREGCLNQGCVQLSETFTITRKQDSKFSVQLWQFLADCTNIRKLFSSYLLEQLKWRPLQVTLLYVCYKNMETFTGLIHSIHILM